MIPSKPKSGSSCNGCCGLMTRPFEYIQPEMDGNYLSKAIHGFGAELSASYYQDLIGAAKGCDSADE